MAAQVQAAAGVAGSTLGPARTTVAGRGREADPDASIAHRPHTVAMALGADRHLGRQVNLELADRANWESSNRQ